MTQRRTGELVADQRIRLVKAHPDDSLWDTILIAESDYADEALLTHGSKGKDLRGNIDSAFGVDKGYRIQEEKAAAAILGLRGVLVYAGLDGQLKKDITRLVPQVAKDAIRDNIGILVGNALNDHPDHEAAGDIAIEAAQLAAQEGHSMGVLILHPFAEGAYWSEATPDSMARTFRAAKKHESQWRIQHDIHADWPIVPGGLSVHPDDMASLALYPFLRDATYTWLPPNQLINMGDVPARLQ